MGKIVSPGPDPHQLLQRPEVGLSECSEKLFNPERKSLGLEDEAIVPVKITTKYESNISRATPNVHHLMWRVAKNWIALLSLDFVSYIKSVPSALFVRFVSMRTNVSNMSCFGVHGLGLCGWSFSVYDGLIVSADKWLVELFCGNLAKEYSAEVIGAVVRWAILKAQNDFVFNGPVPNPEVVVKKSQTNPSVAPLAI